MRLYTTTDEDTRILLSAAKRVNTVMFFHCKVSQCELRFTRTVVAFYVCEKSFVKKSRSKMHLWIYTA